MKIVLLVQILAILASCQRYARTEKPYTSLSMIRHESRGVFERLKASLREEFKDKLLNLEKKQKLLENQVLAINEKMSLPPPKVSRNRPMNNCSHQVTSCQDPCTSGVYRLKVPPKSVYCEMMIFDGRWLVIQQREALNVNFNRSWAEYRAGFGAVGRDLDYWLGLQAIHQITSGGGFEVAIELKNEFGKYGFARYTHFYVAGEDDKYRLALGSYWGTVGDQFGWHHNMKFSTYDNDNDESSRHCARDGGSGWWFNSCFHSDLNRLLKFGMKWDSWTTGAMYSRIMIRRRC